MTRPALAKCFVLGSLIGAPFTTLVFAMIDSWPRSRVLITETPVLQLPAVLIDGTPVQAVPIESLPIVRERRDVLPPPAPVGSVRVGKTVLDNVCRLHDLVQGGPGSVLACEPVERP